MSAGLRVDLWESDGWRWRLWAGSRIVGQSSEAYRRQASAIANLEAVTGGTFEKFDIPDFPEPYGLLQRCRWHNGIHDWFDRIPVRLVTE